MTRVLIVGDAGVNTGFERVTRGVADHLFDIGWDVTVRGVSYHPATAMRHYRYPVKSWAGSAADPLGVRNVPRWLQEDKPTAVLMIQDLWNLVSWAQHLPPSMPSVGYFPVDTPNLLGEHCVSAAAFSKAVTYTQFAAWEAAAGTRAGLDRIFREQFAKHPEDAQYGGFETKRGLSVRMDRLRDRQNPRGWSIIPHGIDLREFRVTNKAAARKLHGLPESAFIVLNVGTNQTRKRLDLTLRAFQWLYQRHDDAVLVIHCQGGNRDGWDLRQLGEYLGIPRAALVLTHEQTKDFDTHSLRALYNAADVQINTAGGEGWGLPAFEGAACGLPQLVPNWAASRELWKDHGVLLEVEDFRVEANGVNSCHAVVDWRAAGCELVRMYEGTLYRTTYSDRARAHAAAQPTWETVGAQFATVLTEALDEPPRTYLTKAQILAARIPHVRSELAGG